MWFCTVLPGSMGKYPHNASNLFKHHNGNWIKLRINSVDMQSEADSQGTKRQSKNLGNLGTLRSMHKRRVC